MQQMSDYISQARIPTKSKNKRQASSHNMLMTLSSVTETEGDQVPVAGTKKGGKKGGRT